MRCTSKCCRAGRQTFELKNMLVLPLPDERSDAVTVFDLYLRYCRGVTKAVNCQRCGCLTDHSSQRRMVTRPNVLVVQARRTLAGDGSVWRHRVRPEARLELRGVGAMELCAVVYHSGVSVDSGHYTCACRGPDGMFWLFDDVTRGDTGCRRLPIDIEQVLQKSVYVLVYVRP